jgi:hypothetical protein
MFCADASSGRAQPSLWRYNAEIRALSEGPNGAPTFAMLRDAARATLRARRAALTFGLTRRSVARLIVRQNRFASLL